MRKQWTGKPRQPDRWPGQALQVLGNGVWVASLPGRFPRLSEMDFTEFFNFTFCCLSGDRCVPGGLDTYWGALSPWQNTSERQAGIWGLLALVPCLHCKLTIGVRPLQCTSWG